MLWISWCNFMLLDVLKCLQRENLKHKTFIFIKKTLFFFILNNNYTSNKLHTTKTVHCCTRVQTRKGGLHYSV